jgi:hypothetical protein
MMYATTTPRIGGHASCTMGLIQISEAVFEIAVAVREAVKPSKCVRRILRSVGLPSMWWL